AGNDHRLGANEAPPAIISIFLGDQLSGIYEKLEDGKLEPGAKAGLLGLGVDVLPPLPKDAGDRNRTSPFAFTGNKFEFRALGSNQSVAGPNVVLNTIVAESIDELATTMEKAVAAGKSVEDALGETIRSVMKDAKAVLFDGDGYSDAWHKEAEKRGLPNYRTTVDALPHLTEAKNVKLFGKYNVLSEREVESREDIYIEQYVKVINIEAETTASIGRTMILPAALAYQQQIAASVSGAKAAGTECVGGKELLDELCGTICKFKAALDQLRKVNDHDDPPTKLEHAKFMLEKVVPAMNTVRELGDDLEKIVPADGWPLPIYRDMLYVK
ncbi:MAG: hypothetical protein WD079_03085, partial [Phycisphaeraceae bacterium]